MNRSFSRGAWVLLSCLVLLAFFFRMDRISAVGLAEDEAGKWKAIEEYSQGHFLADTDHPMLVKMLALASIRLGHAWNRTVPSLVASDEALLRVPNVILGALTTIVVFLMGRDFCSPRVGWLAALLWATGVTAIAIGRILKEDTALTFFTFLAFWLFYRGKQVSDAAGSRPFYLWSGICFGLALASKYFIHFVGLNFFVYYIAGPDFHAKPDKVIGAGRCGLDAHPMSSSAKRGFLACFLVAFLLANPIFLSLANWQAIVAYVGEKTLIHHGYNLDGAILLNNISLTPFGLPWYFYFYLLIVKTPIPALVATLLGAYVLFRLPQSQTKIFFRVMFLFWFLPFSLAGAKWFRYLLVLMPLIYLVAAIGLDSLWRWIEQRRVAVVRTLAGAAVVGLFVTWPALNAWQWAPYHSLFVNGLGGGRESIAKHFPHDELYDLGVREAVGEICRWAPAGSVIAGDNPTAVGYYVARFGRPDISVTQLSDPNYVPTPDRSHFLLVQEGRRYFETDSLFDFLARRWSPWEKITQGGVTAVKVYRYP